MIIARLRFALFLILIHLGSNYSFAQRDENALKDTLSQSKEVLSFDGDTWMYPVESIRNLTRLTRTTAYLFPDTSVKVILKDSSSLKKPIQSIGIAFTPNDPNLELSNEQVALSRYESYYVEDISWNYIYKRNVDSILVDGAKVLVVDTLLVSLYRYDNLSIGQISDSNSNSSEWYAKPNNYSREIGTSTNTYQVIKIPLSVEDTASQYQADGNFNLDLRDPIYLDTDAQSVELEFRNVFGFSLHFIPMAPYESGDTLISSMSVQRPMNYYGVSSYINTSISIRQEEYVNNSWWIEGALGNGDSVNGFQYERPGNDYAQDRYLEYGLRVIYPVGISKLKSIGELKIFPNPVSNNRLFVRLKLLKHGPITFQLTDIFGRELLTKINRTITPTYINQELNLNGITPGIYFLRVSVDDEYTTKKIVVE